MAEITQTNRTILFEKFTEEDGDNCLYRILSENEKSKEPMDSLFSNVIKKLTCHSYKEFLDKFQPVYYDTIQGKETDIGLIPTYGYSLRKPENYMPDSGRKLCEQTFFKAIEELYMRKSKSLKNDLEFEANSIMEEALKPQKAIEKVLEIRREVKYHMEKYLQLEQQKGSIHEKNIHANALKELRKHIKEEYINNNSKFNLIPLRIGQIEGELKARQKKGKNPDSPRESDQYRQADYHWNDKGDLEVTYQEIPMRDMTLLQTSNQNLLEASNTKIYEVLSKDFDKHPANQNANETDSGFRRSMHLAMFTENENSLRTLSDAQLENTLQKCILVYKEATENFFKDILSLVEKVINVKAFFDNAGEGSELIIANCTIEKLMRNKSKEQFEAFIKSVGNQYNNNRIWLSIIPAVYQEDIVELTGSEHEIKLDEDEDENVDNDKATNNVENSDLVPFDKFTEALDILIKNRIITFFNFKGCKKTSQSSLTKELVSKYKEIFEKISRQPESEYAVFCYPNFSLLSEKDTTVKLNEENNIQLPTVYLDASYIACGLTVLTQKCDVLKDKGFKVNASLCPPVRFDFESSFIQGNKKVALRHIFPVKFNRGTLLSWDQDLQKEIAKDGGFGFCFCCDTAGYIDRGISLQQEHPYVYRARTLRRTDTVQNNETKEYYYPLFSTFSKTYVTNCYNFTKVNDIAEKQCNNWNLPGNKEYINNLVYSPKSSSVGIEEKISFSASKNGLVYKITHDKNEENVDVIVED